MFYCLLPDCSFCSKVSLVHEVLFTDFQTICLTSSLAGVIEAKVLEDWAAYHRTVA